MLVARDVFRRLCQARDLLAAEQESPLTVDQVARAAAMSPFHFIRRFEAVFGQTPHQWRTARRLERARLLLAAGDLSVTEICLEVGFSSLGSFSHLFSRRTGETPTAFRRRVRVSVTVPGAVPTLVVPGCFSLFAHLPAHAFRNSGEAHAGCSRAD